MHCISGYCLKESADSEECANLNSMFVKPSDEYITIDTRYVAKDLVLKSLKFKKTILAAPDQIGSNRWQV